MAPFGTALFYAVTKGLQGQMDQLPSTLQDKLIPTLAASYTLWPAAHAINFKFVPSSQRILYTNVVSVRLFTSHADVIILHICSVSCSNTNKVFISATAKYAASQTPSAMLNSLPYSHMQLTNCDACGDVQPVGQMLNILCNLSAVHAHVF